MSAQSDARSLAWPVSQSVRRFCPQTAFTLTRIRPRPTSGSKRKKLQNVGNKVWLSRPLFALNPRDDDGHLPLTLFDDSEAVEVGSVETIAPSKGLFVLPLFYFRSHVKLAVKKV